jgi:hypothetical protein
MARLTLNVAILTMGHRMCRRAGEALDALEPVLRIRHAGAPFTSSTHCFAEAAHAAPPQ